MDLDKLLKLRDILMIAIAFGDNHLDKLNLMDERTRSFNRLILSTDYNKHLDICIVDEENINPSFASFCLILKIQLVFLNL